MALRPANGAPAPDYSTAEHATGAKWTDGKTIYRKVVDLGSLPSEATTHMVAHNISGLDKLIAATAWAVSSGGTRRSVPYVTSTTTDALTLEVNDTVVAIITYASWAGHTAHAILEYTKS